MVQIQGSATCARRQICDGGNLSNNFHYNWLLFAQPEPRGKRHSQSVFRLFNPEPTATAANPDKNTVAVGSGLNDPLPILKN
jgi:hypothetical protein